MPDKGLSVATYAAGASLATIALVYVFAPTYFIDSTPHSSSNPLSALTNRKTGVVGLANAANDCFINSVLQALAGLGDLRIYLIRETHRRKIDDAGVYTNAVPHDAEDSGSEGGPGRRPMPVWKIEGLQAGLVSKGLKDMIDRLNERPIYKKVITAGPFVRVLEIAFQQRISRQQQDAQEFLQVVAERLCDEYHAGRRARRYARQQAERGVSTGAPVLGATGANVAGPSDVLNSNAVNEKLASIASASGGVQDSLSRHETKRSELGTGAENDDTRSEEEGFPMEGKIESQIECLTCGFKPRPSEQAFCTLTLNVPQTSSTSLSACFDSMLKTEYIDEFKCEKCRLVHAKQMFEAELAKSGSESYRNEAKQAIETLQQAIDTDPERPPSDIALPDARYAPKRRIARHFRLVNFPKVLAIHLSRSIYDSSNQSQKNSAKVSFPERLPLGSILNQRKYKLISVVMHKGSHHSGHYESFRRQTVAPPYSNPNTFQPSQIYSPSSSPAATTPKIGSSDASLGISSPSSAQLVDNGSPVSSTAELPQSAAVETNGSHIPHDQLNFLPPKTNAAIGRTPRPSSLRERSSSSSALPPAPTSAPRALAKEEDSNGSSNNNDSAGETASLRSITRSTLSRITSSSRNESRASSRAGSRSRSRNGRLTGRLALRPGSKDGSATTNGVTSSGNGAASKGKTPSTASNPVLQPRPKKKKSPDRWWRISDEKVREASTKEVLGMQREVYLLFYELERDAYMG
ncbi:ubiquitin carboxyl-terminal hydrolase 16 [Sporothrix brasiliensis 5110]|uniref:Ubiquitin carboxyl-terminal hydrolase n=1 Tax=Sporothrix brasiliensis 5110 TaxID=1398154 RepID=A0A0C2IAN3_9PEZI|nr:ubiquitin carboxyl-terminal hydrolase 16 [Sporothrix brasiliensis 5110]KIH86291.1 ubiquitin carboxyl-terminal hydrolase 16 [Sporothrix brasiliensis 5110]